MLLNTVSDPDSQSHRWPRTSGEGSGKRHTSPAGKRGYDGMTELGALVVL